MGWPDAGESLGPGFNGSLELVASICALLRQEHTDVRDIFTQKIGWTPDLCRGATLEPLSPWERGWGEGRAELAAGILRRNSMAQVIGDLRVR